MRRNTKKRREIPTLMEVDRFQNLLDDIEDKKDELLRG